MHFALLAIILINLISSLQVYRVSDPISKVIDNSVASKAGHLYVVATPIGNLRDISHRALQVLTEVDFILAEDTRHSMRLLGHYGINTRLRSCHEHNEGGQIEWVKSQLQTGANLALISDAGTPLISDPGFVLIRALRAAGCSIMTVPGASAIIAALSIAGLPTDGFVYDGFLPAKSSARKAALIEYRSQSRTVVLLESSHRIVACLRDIADILGEQRQVVIARELTKRFETVLSGSVQDVQIKLQQDEDQTRGEFVVLLEGVEPVSESESQVRSLLKALLAELPLKKATALVAQMTGVRKNEVYDLALQVKEEMND